MKLEDQLRAGPPVRVLPSARSPTCLPGHSRRSGCGRGSLFPCAPGKFRYIAPEFILHFMEQPPPAHDPDGYAAWFARRLGEEVRARKEALGLSAYALARKARVTDQTIQNVMHGTHGPLVGTLARLCVCFGTTLSELVTTVEHGRRE